MGMDDQLALFGKHVREVRQAAGLTQEALGMRSGLHPTYIGGIERGERNLSLTNLLKLASGLGVQPSSLMQVFEDGSSTGAKP